VAGGWRRLHNEKLRKLNTSPDITRVVNFWRMRWAGHVARMLVGKPEGKRTRKT
jgi:hypothetical protein